MPDRIEISSLRGQILFVWDYQKIGGSNQWIMSIINYQSRVKQNESIQNFIPIMFDLFTFQICTRYIWLHISDNKDALSLEMIQIDNICIAFFFNRIKINFPLKLWQNTSKLITPAVHKDLISENELFFLSPSTSIIINRSFSHHSRSSLLSSLFLILLFNSYRFQTMSII